MTEGQPKNIFLFPLGTVLFPGGLLPLKIFEQRYLEMTKACLRDNLPFGVCLIREGREVGAPAAPEKVGCLATIEQWDMPTTGMFHLLARGGERFRILETAVTNGLISGDVELLPLPEPCSPDADGVALIKRVIEQVGKENFPLPIKLDEGAWVAYRLVELMNFPMPVKQRVLEMDTISNVFDELKNSIKTYI
ncbi:MAG TPA: LON peptidase substrate-binding domain-containing protein [Burkholderiales bacterium]|nr:LON peptidase substrate-binding domain-containing protein [Burkholderiales bacterium]